MKICAKKLLLSIHLTVSMYSSLLGASVVESQHRDNLISINTVIHDNFMETLNESERLHVTQSYDLLLSTTQEYVRLPKLAATSEVLTTSNPDRIILFVPGMPEHYVTGYSQTLYQLSLLSAPVYLHNWSDKRRLGYNTRHLQRSILKLSQEFPRAQITIIAYCAGGVLTAYALKHFRDNNPELYARLYAHTVATPFAGYGAPRFARVVAPFVGRSIIQVGLGVHVSDLNGQRLRCTQWATVNCDLDWHACPTDSTVPQLIARDGIAVENVCQDGRVNIDNRTHATATAHVIRETFGQRRVDVSQDSNGLLPQGE